ncbi:MAG TPA: homoserine dehydrogenase [Polyangia bacterium]|jgi:homoserine dehydrogenase|nr:homoserine dehydrogenase [Polyangia bacterium]
MRPIGIGLLGLGNVGAGVVQLLRDNADGIAQRVGAPVQVARVAVRALDKPRPVDVPPHLVTTDVTAVLDDPAVDVVVELIGGVEPARSHVLGAIARGKPVVTANKALLAASGDAIFAAAAARRVHVGYEASVCGGVPVLRALRDGLAADRIERLYGIVNGTSNYILTRMTDDGRPFDDVLREAQAHGYAEADPTLDVDGWDAAHKLCVLAMLCFGVRPRPESLLVEGLRNVQPVDIAYAARFGLVIKPLVLGRDHGDAVELRVHPTMIPRRFLLASVGDVFNAIYVSSQALGPSMYYGRGAGMMPTAVGVVSDVIDAAREVLGVAAGVPRRIEQRPARDRPLLPAGDLVSRYYLRFGVVDRPGVLAQLAGILGELDISIREVVQDVPEGPGRSSAGNGEHSARIVMTTHAARERDVQTALGHINALRGLVAESNLIRILD